MRPKAKAAATVTISRIIDVEAEIRYYLKQSATLSAPAKPTSYPPPSAWKTTEPDYTNDSSDASGDTDTLYFVICTVFTNGTYKYSEVSKSSTYEGIRRTETQITQNSGSIELILKRVGTLKDECGADTDKKLQNYVTSSDYSADKENTSHAMEDMTKNINSKANKDELNGYTPIADHNKILKYMRFDENGITIGSGISKDQGQSQGPSKNLTLNLDNDAIKFKNGNEVIGSWDGTNFYTGDIVIKLNQRAQFGNFAFVPRSDGSIMFLKVKD
jgi:hypothetical protein